MSASVTAHSKVVALLTAAIPISPFPSPPPSVPWSYVYGRHDTANLFLPAVSVQVETDLPLSSKAIDQSALHDNRAVRLSVKIHTAYRLGAHDSDSAKTIADAVIRELREHVNLGDGYQIFEVEGVAYDVEHDASATTGAEIQLNVHKVEFYEQS